MNAPLVNVGFSYAFADDDYSVKQAAKDFVIGGVTAPIGGVATRALFKVAKSAFISPVMKMVGNLEKISLRGKKGWEKLAVRTSRFFLNTNRTYPSVTSSWVGRILKDKFPGAQWEMHHVFIQQAWTRVGSSKQIFENAVANEGLRRLGNGTWNLLPIPSRLNNFLGKNELVTQMIATALYSSLVYGPYELYEHLAED